MKPLPEIHAFALKWLNKFNDPHVCIDEFAGFMDQDCTELEFVADHGASFSKKYGWAAFGNADNLREVLDKLDDIMLLGFGILSFWRSFTYWSDCATKALEPQNRAWFIVALEGLADLS